jgi:CPA1 family monovalent cation:H+ antiporter
MPVQDAEIVLLALAFFVVVLAVVARKLQVAYPIVMVIGGLLLSLVPQLPRIRLDPDLVFLVILPPLLFSAAYQISWREFRRNIIGIVMLAFGLVGFTVYGVAGISRFLIPGFDWHTGLVLGSVVAATDAIAATATAKRLGLPRAITELLEAESLVNDGSGLVALRFTLALILTGATPSFAVGVGTLTYLVGMGVLIGLVAGVCINWIQRRISDSSVEITISLITPFVAYLSAEAAQCSGVLATLACGMYLARRTDIYSVRARIEGSAVWHTLDFVLNGLVFLLLGLQLPRIFSEIQGVTTAELIAYGALFSAFVIALRMAYVFPGSLLFAWLRRNILKRNAANPSKKSVFLVGWAGMRGVLALAAAFSLPEKLNNGLPFPHRSMIIFLTFCVIFTTLVLQGLSMPLLIKKLGLARTVTHEQDLSVARRHMVQRALAELDELRKTWSGQDFGVLRIVEQIYKGRLIALEPDSQNNSPLAQEETRLLRRISKQLRQSERAAAYALRDDGKIDDDVLRSLQYELDLRDVTEEA